MSTPDTEVGRNSLEIVRSFIATWNEHDINATMKLLDPDIVFQSPLFSNPVRGIEARIEVNDNFLTSMPDFEYRLLRIASEGDFVAAELVGTGTSTGPTKVPRRDPIPPTGRHVEFPMAGFCPVESPSPPEDQRPLAGTRTAGAAEIPALLQRLRGHREPAQNTWDTRPPAKGQAPHALIAAREYLSDQLKMVLRRRGCCPPARAVILTMGSCEAMLSTSTAI
jgi:limonene-1,2-epoxide hydrolase